jgi:hypothetical protein
LYAGNHQQYQTNDQGQGSRSSSQGMEHNAQDVKRNINTVQSSTSSKAEVGTRNVVLTQLAANKPLAQVGPQVRQSEPKMDGGETQLKTVSGASRVTVTQFDQRNTDVKTLVKSTPSVATTFSSTGMLATSNSYQAQELVRYSPEGEEHTRRSVTETQRSNAAGESLGANGHPLSAAAGNTSSAALPAPVGNTLTATSGNTLFAGGRHTLSAAVGNTLFAPGRNPLSIADGNTSSATGGNTSLAMGGNTSLATGGNTSLAASGSTSSAAEENIVIEELVLRNYQLELAEKAKEGENCIIVAPTGSGKTIVAIDIIRVGTW